MAEQSRILKLGIHGFDGLFATGIPSGSAVLVEGGPGSGKTNFCLTALLSLCKQGHKCLYMSFEEPEPRLREHLSGFSIKPEELEKKGILKIKRFNALDIARSVEALLSEAKKELLIDVQPVLIPTDFEPDIVFVDSLTSISSAFSGEEYRFRIYMEQFFRYLEKNNITSFLIREVAHPTHTGDLFEEQGEAVSFLSDGIIAIYNTLYTDTGKRGRALEVVKMRGTEFKRQIVEFEITKEGLKVYAERMLKGPYKLT
ncbi:MAG: ATPase domain-containing protein [Candidatus ainarchaeum sp.]|nr:ATPase domain-containing protein [Candidatus ainarchaeum sp.]